MMAEHKKWTYRHRPPYAEIVDVNGCIACDWDDRGRSAKPSQEHGELMASAPELRTQRDALLAACKGLVEVCGRETARTGRPVGVSHLAYGYAMTKARDAIAIAEPLDTPEPSGSNEPRDDRALDTDPASGRDGTNDA